MLARTALIATAAATAASLAPSPASAAPGPGTFTRITTPARDTTFHWQTGSMNTNRIRVTGVASRDVTAVDVLCINTVDGFPASATLATAVPVVAGTFTVAATVQDRMRTCRLRAVPVGETLDAYLGAYSGPLLASWGLDHVGSEPSFLGWSGQGDGFLFQDDAGACGVATLQSIPRSTLERGPNTIDCALFLGEPGSLPTSSPNRSIHVDGHIAYLPSAVSYYLRQMQHLTVPDQPLVVHESRARDGSVTFTESAPLVRCAHDDYPPTVPTCDSLVPTHVRFDRTATLLAGGHRVRIRDRFTSTDGKAHSADLRYTNSFEAPERGELGYRVPGRSSLFTAAPRGLAVHLPVTRAGSYFVRSDRFAAEGDELADTVGVTWSRAPLELAFDDRTSTGSQLHYRLGVPAGGTAFLGFAVSEGRVTGDVQRLAAAAQREMIAAPVVSSPRSGARLRRHVVTVRGRVAAGANGLPTVVTVNGRRARLHRVSRTSAVYGAAVRLASGRRHVGVVARDNAGNVVRRVITVRVR